MQNPINMIASIPESVQRYYASLKTLEKWVEGSNYRGYEPFDGLSSRFRPLTRDSLFLDRLLLQLVRQSPINLRPLFGVKPLDSTIGRGYMAWGYCHMFQVSGDIEYRKKVESCLGWLMENRSADYTEYSWGKHFDFASRGGLYRAHEPILIWTALIGHAFLEAYEIFRDSRYLEVADSVCKWILKLPRNISGTGFCIGYHNHDKDATIHNSNMVGAAVLARTSRHSGNREYLAVAREAMRFSCSRQLPNGAWFYGEALNQRWVDNFHTGYNLDGLKCYIENSGDMEYESNLKRGLAYYVENFFEVNGRPRYYNNRTYPVDIQCASQAIETLSNFSDHDTTLLASARRVMDWTIENMQDKNGYFYYRQFPVGKAKTPMLHWGQATMYKSLAVYICKHIRNARERSTQPRS